MFAERLINKVILNGSPPAHLCVNSIIRTFVIEM